MPKKSKQPKNDKRLEKGEVSSAFNTIGSFLKEESKSLAGQVIGSSSKTVKISYLLVKITGTNILKIGKHIRALTSESEEKLKELEEYLESHAQAGHTLSLNDVDDMVDYVKNLDENTRGKVVNWYQERKERKALNAIEVEAIQTHADAEAESA